MSGPRPPRPGTPDTTCNEYVASDDPSVGPCVGNAIPMSGPTTLWDRALNAEGIRADRVVGPYAGGYVVKLMWDRALNAEGIRADAGG